MPPDPQVVDVGELEPSVFLFQYIALGSLDDRKSEPHASPTPWQVDGSLLDDVCEGCLSFLLSRSNFPVRLSCFFLLPLFLRVVA